jgi:uncharacterized protein YcfJ
MPHPVLERSITVSDQSKQSKQSKKIRYATDDAEDATAVSDAAPVEETPRQEKAESRRNTAVGAVVGGAIGAVTAGPVGAAAGAAAGAAIGAANSADEDDPDTTGNVTDDDQRRVKRTYSGKVYEEGSLQDVRRKDEI